MERIRLQSITTIAGNHPPQRSTVKVEIDGEIITEEADGNGVVDAIFHSIFDATKSRFKLPDSQLVTFHFQTNGSDQQTYCWALFRLGDRYISTKGIDVDETVAVAKATCACFEAYVQGRPEQEDEPPSWYMGAISHYVDASEKESEVEALISKLDDLIEIIASKNQFGSQLPDEKETILGQLISAKDMLKPRIIAAGCLTAILLPTLYRIGEKLRDAAADRVVEQCLALLHKILL